MQIELDNAQTLFCYMTEDDFRALNIFPDKLTYGSNSFRRLISLIMSRAEDKYHFSSDELPTMVEAVPLSNGEFFIQITLIDEAEELDPRFAQFAPSVFDELTDVDELDDMNDMANEIASPTGHITPVRGKRRTPNSTASGTMYTFTTYEALATAIKSGGNPESYTSTKSSLYYHPGSKNYHLIIKRGKINADLRALLASLCEYATARTLTSTSNAWLNEHCRCIFRKNAISSLLEQINA